MQSFKILMFPLKLYSFPHYVLSVFIPGSVPVLRNSHSIRQATLECTVHQNLVYARWYGNTSIQRQHFLRVQSETEQDPAGLPACTLFSVPVAAFKEEQVPASIEELP